MRALAIICAFNEADIIGWTVRHLIQQGLAVHVIDTASTDDTCKIARKAGAAVEHYPVVGGKVSWRALLQRVEQLANDPGSPHHWYMHCDADEIRRSPLKKNNWTLETLLDTFDWMDKDGYNAAEFEVRTFRPTDNGYDGSQDPEQYFTEWTRDTMNERIGQVKAWKYDMRGVMLAWSGGHRIKYKYDGIDVKVHPVKLISNHYPIRSQQHGERKVFAERRGRWSDPEKDWHIQYQGIKQGDSFLVKP
jgi:glycosyltransferase involved in cell wall biosynthesis